MRKPTIWTAVALSACVAAAEAREISREELKAALEKNPDIVLDVIKNNKKAFIDVLNEAIQEEQARRQKEAEEAEKKDFEESFKNPKAPEISEKTRIRGNKSAKYTLVEYSDFQCFYCGKAYHTVEALRKKYGTDLRFVYKNKPLGNHPEAMPAALHFEAAALQSAEKAWAFHDALFQHQDRLGEPFYKEVAAKLGLDMKRLQADAKSDAVREKVMTDLQESEKFGFTGTPGFLLNGIPIRGAYPEDFFHSVIKRLDLAGKEPAAGSRPPSQDKQPD